MISLYYIFLGLYTIYTTWFYYFTYHFMSSDFPHIGTNTVNPVLPAISLSTCFINKLQYKNRNIFKVLHLTCCIQAVLNEFICDFYWLEYMCISAIENDRTCLKIGCSSLHLLPTCPKYQKVGSVLTDGVVFYESKFFLFASILPNQSYSCQYILYCHDTYFLALPKNM